MHINFLNSSIHNISKTKNIPTFKANQSFLKTISFKGDTFERNNTKANSGIEETQKTQGAAPAEWSKEKIEALYNETYDEVMEQNPICEELNIQKPRFKIVNNSSLTSLQDLAGYSFPSNEMLISSGAYDDFYLCIAMNNDTGKQVSLGICDKNNAKENYKISREYGYDMNAIKLNHKEKEAFLKTIISHELRHCIQMHLIASTKECSRPFKKSLARMAQEKWAEYNKISKMLEELNKQADEYGLEQTTIEPPDTEYIDNFVAKKIISEDTKLKFSLSKEDTRYLSTREHLLNGFLMQTSKVNQKEVYEASPLEMDANNYAYQYFCTKLNKNTGYGDIRPVVSNEIQVFYFDRAKKGICSMNQFGYPNLIKK